MPEKRAQGRLQNPYAHRLPWFQPKATVGAMAETDLELAEKVGIEPGTYRLGDLRWHAFGVIMNLRVPVLRRVVESILVHDHGFYPPSVTNALQFLRSEGTRYIGDMRIIRTSLIVPGEAKPSDVYTFDREPTVSELRDLTAMCVERNLILTREMLKTAGERYVRAWLLSTGAYSRVTREAHLGAVNAPTLGNSVDLMATESGTAIRYAISVKNQRAWLTGKDRAISDILKRAYAHKVHPWLVAPFALDTAINQCRTSGVRLTTLGKQIVTPKDSHKRSVRTLIQRLRPVLGVQPYGFVLASSRRSAFDPHVTYEAD